VIFVTKDSTNPPQASQIVFHVVLATILHRRDLMFVLNVLLGNNRIQLVSQVVLIVWLVFLPIQQDLQFVDHVGLDHFRILAGKTFATCVH